MGRSFVLNDLLKPPKELLDATEDLLEDLLKSLMDLPEALKDLLKLLKPQD